jgi:hypothetical protein
MNLFFFFFPLAVLGFELRASCLLGKHSYHLSLPAQMNLDVKERGKLEKKLGRQVNSRGVLSYEF